MKFCFPVIKLAAIACIAFLATAHVSACQCGARRYGKSDWEWAKSESDWATLIFEGTPERFDFQWNLLTAKDGELISADYPSAGIGSDGQPAVLLTFRVQRAYKGDLGPEIQIRTGLGGGDCAAIFAPGLTYLVFASKTAAGDLAVSMCSPGGWIADKTVATEVRYLRKERPIASDLAPSKRLTPKENAAQEAQRHRDFEDFQKRYAAVTGKICGKVVPEKSIDASMGVVSFLSTNGSYPFARPIAVINPDGSFCSGALGPGKYYLYFTKFSDVGLASAVYYPGVSERFQATTVEVSGGQTQSNIAFKIPTQKSYSVRGIISTNDKSGLDARSVEVALMRLEDGPFPAPYSKTIDFRSSYPLPKTKYFAFENVLPGRYIAYVSVQFGQGWHTRKEVVNVTNHMKFISLQLEHTK